MKDKENKKSNKTYIGGQAVIEGVMMRGKTGVATAVRDAEGVIRVEAERVTPPEKKKAFLLTIKFLISSNMFSPSFSFTKIKENSPFSNSF